MALELRPRASGARKTAFLTIDADNRDHGKRFLLTEMSARQAEKWFYRFVLAINRGGGGIPEWVTMAGMAALPSLASFNPNVLSFLSWAECEPLLDELMACIQAWPDGSPIARSLVASDTEEYLTLTQLRLEVLALHVGFSVAAFLWRAAPSIAAEMGLERPPEPPAVPTPPTSPIPSP